MLLISETTLYKPGSAQVSAPLKFQKTEFLKYAKDTIAKISSISQCRKISERIRIRLANHIFPNWKQNILFLKYFFSTFSENS